MASLSTAYACRISVTMRFLFWRDDLWAGQAFALDAYRLITNDHVVGRPERTINGIRLNGKMLAITRIITAKEALGTDDDLAVIECAEPHGIPVPPLAATAPEVGDLLQFINQDGQHYEARLHSHDDGDAFFKALEDAGLVDYTDPGFKKGKELRERVSLYRTAAYHTGLNCRHGDSGSAAYNEAGEVIGVIFAIHRYTDQALVVPHHVLHRFLEAISA